MSEYLIKAATSQNAGDWEAFSHSKSYKQGLEPEKVECGGVGANVGAISLVRSTKQKALAVLQTLGMRCWGEMDAGLGVESNDYLLIPGGQKFFSLIKESLAEVLKMISDEGLSDRDLGTKAPGLGMGKARPA